jgi:hypothetical protein
MSKTRLVVVAALLASILTSCFVETRARPCRTDCWWEHGRRVCERRCR